MHLIILQRRAAAACRRRDSPQVPTGRRSSIRRTAPARILEAALKETILLDSSLLPSRHRSSGETIYGPEARRCYRFKRLAIPAVLIVSTPNGVANGLDFR